MRDLVSKESKQRMYWMEEEMILYLNKDLLTAIPTRY